MVMKPPIAELRFASQGISLTGTVVNMTGEQVTVKLHSRPALTGLYAVDSVVEMIVIAKNTMFTAATRIRAINNTLLRLAFSAPVRSVRRRREVRVPIELDVQIRPIQENGCSGAWRHALSRNISSGGMCLHIAPGHEPPPRIEILFMLPADESSCLLSSALDPYAGQDCPGTSSELRLEMQRLSGPDRPVKATARAINRRIQADGTSLVGVAFVLLSPLDQIRLTQFLNGPIAADLS